MGRTNAPRARLAFRSLPNVHWWRLQATGIQVVQFETAAARAAIVYTFTLVVNVLVNIIGGTNVYTFMLGGMG